eukprot:1160453-Pelagomonas_calceolata.AAC.13
MKLTCAPRDHAQVQGRLHGTTPVCDLTHGGQREGGDLAEGRVSGGHQARPRGAHALQALREGWGRNEATL